MRTYRFARQTTTASGTIRRLVFLLVATGLAAPGFAGTIVQVDKTGEASFTVEYEKSTRIGGIEKAMEGAERFAGALCEAAGFSFYRVLDRQAVKSTFSPLPTRGDSAVVEVEMLDAAPEDAMASPCEKSRKKDLRKAKRWLETLRYVRPPRAGG